MEELELSGQSPWFEAVQAAATLHAPAFENAFSYHGQREGAIQAVLETASMLYASGPPPAWVLLTPSHPRTQDGYEAEPFAPITYEGDTMAAVLTTSQEFELTADPEDARGFDVDVPVEWTVESEDDAVEIVDTDDPKTVIIRAVQPGSALVKASVGELYGSLAVDVTAGAVATIEIAPGEVREQGTTGGGTEEPPTDGTGITDEVTPS